jgi:hypothetical protein
VIIFELLIQVVDWIQKDHASEWILLENNIGESLSLDETTLCRDLTTFLSNKDGHGKKGSIIIAVCGTISEDVTQVIKKHDY